MIENDRFIDVPKALVRKAANLARTPRDAAAALEALFASDLTDRGMEEAIHICQRLTDAVSRSSVEAEQEAGADR